MRTVTLAIAAPHRWLAINDRGHWAQRSAGVRTWRESAALTARQVRIGKIRSPFTVSGVIHKPTAHAWDVDGISPTVKACLDGLRDVGVITEDDYRHMRSFTTEAGEKGTPYLVLTLTEIDPTTPFAPHPERKP